MTPAHLRPLGEADLIERTRYYAASAGEAAANRFFNTAISALHAVERMPGTGTPRIGQLTNIAGLRMRRVEGFPCGWYYFVHHNHLDVVRLLADAQDLRTILDALNNDPHESGETT